jgi:hypothetical protein
MLIAVLKSPSDMGFNCFDGGEFILNYTSEFSFARLKLNFMYVYAERKINTNT